MELSTAILVALAGYLIGSISAARLIVAIVKPGASLDQARTHRTERGEAGTVSGIGASTASIVLGQSYGPIVAVLDMLKALVPILALRFIFPDQRYDLVFSVLAITGHIFPVYYRFEGGRGLSPMLGSLLVIEPAGLIVAMLAGTLIGILLNQPHLALVLWFPLLTSWSWFVRQDILLTLYCILLLILFIAGAIPEIRLAMQYRKKGRMDEYNRMILESAPQMRMMKRLAGKLRFWEADSAGPGD